MKKSENIKQERLTHTEVTQNPDFLPANAEVLAQESIINNPQVPPVSQQAVDAAQSAVEVTAADYQAIALVDSPPGCTNGC